MFLVDVYEYLSDSLIKEKTSWYKQPIFILGVILSGVALSAYIYYLRRKAERLKVKITTSKIKAKQQKHRAIQADRKEDIKKLKRTAKKQQEKVEKTRTKLNKVRSRHRNLESSIDKANSLSEIIDLSRQVNESGSSS